MMSETGATGVVYVMDTCFGARMSIGKPLSRSSFFAAPVLVACVQYVAELWLLEPVPNCQKTRCFAF